MVTLLPAPMTRFSFLFLALTLGIFPAILQAEDSRPNPANACQWQTWNNPICGRPWDLGWNVELADAQWKNTLPELANQFNEKEGQYALKTNTSLQRRYRVERDYGGRAGQDTVTYDYFICSPKLRKTYSNGEIGCGDIPKPSEQASGHQENYALRLLKSFLLHPFNFWSLR